MSAVVINFPIRRIVRARLAGMLVGATDEIDQIHCLLISVKDVQRALQNQRQSLLMRLRAEVNRVSRVGSGVK
jgi:hypothetical protein